MQDARAVTIRGRGGPEVLSIEARAVRDPGPGEVRVAVRAAGLNRADSLQRKGFYPAPPGFPADVPGLEFAGEIEALGPEVRGARVGDRVMGITGGGGMATQLVVHERELVPIPSNLGFAEAAAIPEVFFTSFDALVVQASIGLGSTVLVHAVGSGIGTAAVQLVRATGGRSIGTSRSQAKLDRTLPLGLDHGVLVGAEGTFAERVRAFAAAGADAVLDTIGAAYLDENIASLATSGTVVTIGLLGGAKGTLSLGALLAKRGVLRGSTLRARPLEEKAALAQRIGRELVPLFERGVLVPVIDEVLPMERIREAHERLDANETFGKLVLTW